MRAFSFHLGLVALVFAIVAVALRWWRQALALLPAVGFLLYDGVIDFVPNGPPPTAASAPTVKILTANLLFSNRDMTRLMKLIDREQPDVVLFQEYTHPMDELLSNTLGAAYPHSMRLPQEDSFGEAFFSRLPFVKEPAPAWFPGIDPAPQLRGVVSVGDATMAIYNIHLLPVFRTYFLQEHNAQLDEITRCMRREKLPCVWAGDFNFTARNAQATVLRQAGLHDAWRQRGWGRGSTWCAVWPLSLFPGFRIDQMQMSEGVVCHDIRVMEDIGSDHYPLVGEFGIIEGSH